MHKKADVVGNTHASNNYTWTYVRIKKKKNGSIVELGGRQ